MLYPLGTGSIDGTSYAVDAAGEPDGKDYQATGVTQSCARKQVARKKFPTFCRRRKRWATRVSVYVPVA
jgi:hypothetical protein